MHFLRILENQNLEKAAIICLLLMKGKLLDFPLYFFAFLECLLLQYKNIFKYIKTFKKCMSILLYF